MAVHPPVGTLWIAKVLEPLFNPDCDPACQDTPALIYIDADMRPHGVTRREFCEAVARIAWGLSEDAVRSGGCREDKDPLLIAHPSALSSIFAFWAGIVLNALPSMFPTQTDKIDKAIYQHNMRQLALHSHARGVFTDRTFGEYLGGVMPCPMLDEADILAHAAGHTFESLRDDFMADVQPPAPECYAFLQHSSGTTGLQKGVALSHGSVLNQLSHYAEALALDPSSDVIVSWLPLYHDMGLIAGFMLPLVAGVPLVLMSPFDWVAHPAMLLRAITDYHGTLCWLPNFAYNHMARRVRAPELEGVDLSGVRAFINCSEPVRADSHAAFVRRFEPVGARMDQLAVSYAMAENTFAVTQTPVGEAAHQDMIDRDALHRDGRAIPVDTAHPRAAAQVSCGRPIAGTQVKVVRDDGAHADERQVGEVVVRSDCMLSGYYRRDDLVAFDSDGWYRTGDRGYLAAGEVYIVGRSKDLIITAGKNIYPQDIEDAAYGVEGVHPGRAVAFGVQDQREGTELIALVVEIDPEHDHEGERKRIFGELKRRIASQTEVTVSYVTLVARGWLIKTTSGKAARGANRDKWLAQQATDGE